jgi:hypothetical protein
VSPVTSVTDGPVVVPGAGPAVAGGGIATHAVTSPDTPTATAAAEIRLHRFKSALPSIESPWR